MDKIQTEETFSTLAKALFNAGASHKELHGLLDLALDEAGEEQDKLGNDPRMFPGEDMDGDFDSGMASAGMGTDEDYGFFGNDNEE